MEINLCGCGHYAGLCHSSQGSRGNAACCPQVGMKASHQGHEPLSETCIQEREYETKPDSSKFD